MTAKTVEELETQLNTAVTTVEKVDLLNAFCGTHSQVNPQQTLILSQRAYDLAQRSSPYLQGLYDSLINLSACHFRLGNSELAMEHAMQAHSMAITQNSVQATPRLFITLGALFRDLGEHKEALNYYLQALPLVANQNNPDEELPILTNLGIISHLLHDYAQELAYYTKALDLQTMLGINSSTAVILNNMAMAYQAMGELETAVAKAQQSLTVAREQKLNTVEANTLCTLGELYLDQKSVEQALFYLNESARLANTLGFLYVETYSLRKIGEALHHENRFDEALPFLQKALKLAEQLQNQMELAACHNALAQSYKCLNNAPQALHHFEQFHTLDKKLYQEQADRHIQQLQIVHKTRTIQQEAELYKQKTEELDAYARTVAHDLKQPIAAIVGYADLLPEIMPANAENALLLKAVAAIGQSAEQADRTIRALLLLATVNKTAVPVEPIDMAAIVKNALQQLQIMIQEKSAIVHLPDRWGTAVGHQPWLEEVWRNYLINALKYSGSPPELTIGCDSATANMTRFWLEDNGPGIPPQYRANLFKEFSHLPKTNSSDESHGLGLAIVKRIIEKLGGEVGYEAGPERGSIFFFTLPTQLSEF